MRPKYLLLIFLIILPFREIIAQTTITLQPGPEGKDTWVWSINPNSNYGDVQSLPAMGWTFSGVPGAKRSLIDFDLSDIPPTAIILDARLDLYYNCIEPTYVTQSGDNEAYLRLITTPWDEYGPTWNNQPATTTTDQVYLPRSTEPEQDYTDIDVTVQIAKMHIEPDNYHGFMLQLINEYPYNCLLFASSDWTVKEKRPRLTVTYLECELPIVNFI
ncbi:MAG: DNRLRE domain-containing protein, partial [Bacteroidales bacterium]|nr:DNRLRE domain-containing protein [Bacteroidales bacterium]